MIATVDTIAAPASSSSSSRRPSIDQLNYAKEAMTVALLALAFLWLIPRLLTRPGKTLEAVGRRVAAK